MEKYLGYKDERNDEGYTRTECYLDDETGEVNRYSREITARQFYGSLYHSGRAERMGLVKVTHTENGFTVRELERGK